MSLFEALEMCLRAIKEEGLPPEVALARFPEYAVELRELIFVAEYLESVPPVTPSASFRLATREKIRKLKPPATNGRYAADSLNGAARSNGLAKRNSAFKPDDVALSGGSTMRASSTRSFAPNPIPPRSTVAPLPARQEVSGKQPLSLDKPLAGREAVADRSPVAGKGTLVEKRLAARAIRQPETRHRRRSAWGPLWAAASAAAILLAVFAGTLFGSLTSLPGSPLYSVKRASEWVRLNLAPSQGDRVLLLSGFANRRADEITALAGQGGQETLIRANQAVDDYNTTLHSITTQLPLPQTLTHQVAGDLSEQESKLVERGDKLPQDRKEPVMQALDIVRETRSQLLGLPLRPPAPTATPTSAGNPSQELPSRGGPVVLPGVLSSAATHTPTRVPAASPTFTPLPTLTDTPASGGVPAGPMTTATSVPPTATPQATATDVPVATLTQTVAPPSPSATSTARPAAPQPTSTPTVRENPTNTPVVVNPPPRTNTPEPTATPVIMLTVVTATATPVPPTATNTRVPSPTNTPAPPRPSNTPTPVPTNTPEPTATPHANRPPHINSVNCSPCNIFTQSSSNINVSVSDPDGDPLTFSWSAGPGSVSGSGASANYHAGFTFSPTGASYPVSVGVTVNDGKGGSSSGSVIVVVTQQ